MAPANPTWTSNAFKTQCRIRILASDGTPLEACPDTGSSISSIEHAALLRHFPTLQIHRLKKAAEFGGIGGGKIRILAFVYLPIRCISTNNKLLEFPTTSKVFLTGKLFDGVAILGLNFLVPNALRFCWGREDGFATHRLQIGDTDSCIRVKTERSVHMMAPNPIPICSWSLSTNCMPSNGQHSSAHRNAFHAIFLSFRVLLIAVLFSLLGFCLVIAILVVHGQETLSYQVWLWALNLILFAWVAMHAVALLVLEWDSWWEREISTAVDDQDGGEKLD
jgi:hypothetical protein